MKNKDRKKYDDIYLTIAKAYEMDLLQYYLKFRIFLEFSHRQYTEWEYFRYHDLEILLLRYGNRIPTIRIPRKKKKQLRKEFEILFEQNFVSIKRIWFNKHI